MSEYPIDAVAYAAATYAIATGMPATADLLAYRSESQILIASAVYDVLTDVSWRRVAIAAGCPNDKNKIVSLDMAVRHRKARGRMDLDLHALCSRAVRERKLLRASAPAALPPEPTKPALDFRPKPDPAPIAPEIPPVNARQIRKPETDLDKEIYGLPPKRRLSNRVLVAVSFPGDKPEDWQAPEARPGDQDPATVSVESRDLNRPGSARMAKPKRITLPRIPSLERPLSDE